MTDEDTKPPTTSTRRRVQKVNARREKAMATDTEKVKLVTKAVRWFAKARKHPGILGGLSVGGGAGLMQLVDTFTTHAGYKWLYFGVGIIVVLAWGGLDYLAALFRHVEKQGEDVADIRDMVADGFDEGEERFAVIERQFRDHVENHPGPSKPRRKSGGRLQPHRPATDETAVVPPIVDFDDVPEINPDG